MFCNLHVLAHTHTHTHTHSHDNFNGVFVSLSVIFRVMTGEDWHQLMWDYMVIN